MRRKFLEQTVLFLSIIKWTFLATIVGTLVGLGTTIFLKALNISLAFTSRQPYYLFLLPLGGFLAGLIIYKLAPEAEGHGTEQVISAVHENFGKIRAKVAPVKLIATISSIASGGSAGKEGPCAQIGGSIASTLANFMRLKPTDRRKLVICGISAGFASVFGTPVAGAIFGIEVLFLGQVLYEVLFPSFVAGITSYQVSKALGIRYFYHPINFVPQFTEVAFLKIILAGVIFGLISLMLIESLKICHNFFNRLRLWKPLKPALGGFILMVAAFLVGRSYLGLGLKVIADAISGSEIPPLAFLLKIFFTSVTLGSGGSGGIVTPIFFIGASSGSLISKLLNIDAALLASIGMVALLSGSANTPISASIMAIEFFGPNIAPYAAIACVVAFLASGHRSVYFSQILGMRKADAIEVPLQKELGEISGVDLSKDAKGILRWLESISARFKGRK